MKKLLFLAIAGSLFLSSCTMTSKSMREPFTRVELNRGDFELSQQFTASATTTKILGIDFSRLFLMEKGTIVQDGVMPYPSLSMIPIIGSTASQFLGDYTANYALYTMMMEHPGYDVVFYPSYTTKVERPILLKLYTITTVDVTARLAKLK